MLLIGFIRYSSLLNTLSIYFHSLSVVHQVFRLCGYHRGMCIIVDDDSDRGRKQYTHPQKQVYSNNYINNITLDSSDSHMDTVSPEPS